MAREFVAELAYETEPGGETKDYDLKVNHPLSIGGTDIFLIGHGYAPVITIRDGEGEVTKSGPVVFLPTNSQTFESFGVVKAPFAQPEQIGLEGTFYPTFAMGRDADGNLTMPASVWGDALDPLISMSLWTGDLGVDDGSASSVYVLDKADATQVTKADGQPFRMDLRPGESVDAARRPRHRVVRRAPALEQDPDQPQPRQAGGAGWCGARAARPAGLAVHPPAPDVGAGPAAGRRHHPGRGRPPRPRPRAGDPEDGAPSSPRSWRP